MASIVGSWVATENLGAAGGIVFLTFSADQSFHFYQNGDSVADPSGQSGVELGTYSYDQAASNISINIQTDTNGAWGFSDAILDSVSVTDDLLTFVGRNIDEVTGEILDDFTVDFHRINTSTSTNSTVKSSESVSIPETAETLTLTGNAPAAVIANDTGNTISGNSSANALYGGDGDDKLSGGDGDDFIVGGSGSNILDGGKGDDTYIVTLASDSIIEKTKGGTDTIVASVDYTLGNNIENLTLNGSTNIAGTGNKLLNKLVGNAGNNSLNGSIGNDTLTGGDGNDIFVFNSKLNGKSNVDAITDFSSGADSIELDHSIFKKLSVSTQLDSVFHIGSKAENTTDLIVYNNTNGNLYYDADGSGKGTAVLFATLTGAPTISASDIYLI